MQSLKFFLKFYFGKEKSPASYHGDISSLTPVRKIVIYPRQSTSPGQKRSQSLSLRDEGESKLRVTKVARRRGTVSSYRK